MVSETTNVRAEQLNYDAYAMEIYDEDIKRSIPGHDDLHEKVQTIVREFSKKHELKKILELGIGTGLTSEKILRIVPAASLRGVDFSGQMMLGAKKRLAGYNVRYIFGDFSKVKFGGLFDMVISVIGIHHQSNVGKRKLFEKIWKCLNPGGIFIFGDLFTYRDQKKAAANDARHYHHLVENARNEQSLEEWAHHHKFLNVLAPMEDQIRWLKKAGFAKVEIKYEYLNTALLLAKK